MTYGPAEMLTIALAREIREGDIVFHGLASPVPVTAMKLAKALGKNFTELTIAGGVDPDWRKPAFIGSTLSCNRFEGSVAFYGLDEIFDLACSGRLDIAFLSFAQLDQYGHINMSWIGGTNARPKVRMPGGAGTATLTRVTKRTIIWKTKQDPRCMVPQVDCITTTPNPDKEFRVLTDLAIFDFRNGKLRLEAIYPYATLEEVQKNTGWEITEKDVPTLVPPTEEELVALEKVDPNRIRYVEF